MHIDIRMSQLETRKRKYDRLIVSTKTISFDANWASNVQFKRQYDSNGGCACFATQGDAIRGYCCLDHRPTKGDLLINNQACARCNQQLTGPTICLFCGTSYCSACYVQLARHYGKNSWGDSRHRYSHHREIESIDMKRGLAHCPLCISTIHCASCFHPFVYVQKQGWLQECGLCSTNMIHYLLQLIDDMPKDMINIIVQFGGWTDDPNGPTVYKAVKDHWYYYEEPACPEDDDDLYYNQLYLMSF